MDLFLFGRGDKLIEEQPQPHEIIPLPKFHTDAFIKKAVELYESGYSLRHIALRSKATKTQVRIALIKEGVRLRPSPASPEGVMLMRKKRLPSNPPYGYVWIRSKLIEHPVEMETAKLILSLHASGMGLCRIARELNAKEVPTRKRGKWDHSTVRNIIKRSKEA